MSCVCSASWSIPQSSKPLKPPKLPQLAAIARRPMHPVLSSLLYIKLPLHYNTLHYNWLDCKAPCIPFFLHYGPMQAKPGHWSPARWWWDENWERVHLPPKMPPPPHTPPHLFQGQMQTMVYCHANENTQEEPPQKSR